MNSVNEAQRRNEGGEMNVTKTSRGFTFVTHKAYSDQGKNLERLISESSVVGDYEDSYDNPGSSYLWVGDGFHLNREEVSELVKMMTNWLETGRLKT